MKLTIESDTDSVLMDAFKGVLKDQPIRADGTHINLVLERVNGGKRLTAYTSGPEPPINP